MPTLAFRLPRLPVIALALIAPLSALGATTTVTVVAGPQYSPRFPTILAGDRVQFFASSFHPLRFDSDTGGNNACDGSCTKTFVATGQHAFYCLNHGGPSGFAMSGIITVSPNPDLIFLDGNDPVLVPSG